MDGELELKAIADPAVEAKEMDLETARVVLQAIVDVNENAITEQTPLDRIQEYSIDQIRQAVQLVTESLKDKSDEIYPWPEKGESAYFTLQQTPQGELYLFKGDDFVELALMSTRFGPDISDRFALDDKEGFDKRFIHFSDVRSGANIHTGLTDLEKAPTLAKVRYMIKGMRWMSANLLNWENHTALMPEDIQAKELSPGSKPALPSST